MDTPENLPPTPFQLDFQSIDQMSIEDISEYVKNLSASEKSELIRHLIVVPRRHDRIDERNIKIIEILLENGGTVTESNELPNGLPEFELAELYYSVFSKSFIENYPNMLRVYFVPFLLDFDKKKDWAWGKLGDQHEIIQVYRELYENIVNILEFENTIPQIYGNDIQSIRHIFASEFQAHLKADGQHINILKLLDKLQLDNGPILVLNKSESLWTYDDSVLDVNSNIKKMNQFFDNMNQFFDDIHDMDDVIQNTLKQCCENVINLKKRLFVLKHKFLVNKFRDVCLKIINDDKTNLNQKVILTNEPNKINTPIRQIILNIKKIKPHYREKKLSYSNSVFQRLYIDIACYMFDVAINKRQITCDQLRTFFSLLNNNKIIYTKIRNLCFTNEKDTNMGNINLKKEFNSRGFDVPGVESMIGSYLLGDNINILKDEDFKEYGFRSNEELLAGSNPEIQTGDAPDLLENEANHSVDDVKTLFSTYFEDKNIRGEERFRLLKENFDRDETQNHQLFLQYLEDNQDKWGENYTPYIVGYVRYLWKLKKQEQQVGGAKKQKRHMKTRKNKKLKKRTKNKKSKRNL